MRAVSYESPRSGARRDARRKALTSLELKGLSDERRVAFTKAVNALGFRGTMSGTKLVVPTRDAGQIRHLLDIERQGVAEVQPVVTAFDLYDTAWEIERGDPAPEHVEAFLKAHESFIRRPPSGQPPRGYAEVVGRAEAVATLVRSGRLDRAAASAARLRSTWEQSR